MKRFLICLFTACVALLLFSAGCSGDDDDVVISDDDDTTDYGNLGPEEECQVPTHCTTKYNVSDTLSSYWKCNVLDAENKVSRCVCLANEGCPGNELCHPYTGVCYQKEGDVCKVQEDCKDSEKYCNIDENLCEPKSGLCQVCTEGFECLGEKCGTSYEEDSELKHCSASCEKDSDCNDDGSRFACVNGLCAPARADCCQSNFDCQSGQRCNEEYHICEAYCETHEDCPEAQKCCNHECVRELYCDSSCDCLTWGGSQLICNYVKKECSIPCTGVEPDSEESCPPGTVMLGGTPKISNGKCVPPDCPMGTSCKPDNGECGMGCTTNSDCTLSQICEGGACKSGHCQTSDICQCGEFCKDGSCSKPSQDYCQTNCTPGMTCGGSASNYCLQIGDTMFDTYCGINCDSGGQSNDQLCPKSFACTGLVDATGSIVGHVCYPTSGSCDNGGCG